MQHFRAAVFHEFPAFTDTDANSVIHMFFWRCTGNSLNYNILFGMCHRFVRVFLVAVLVFQQSSVKNPASDSF